MLVLMSPKSVRQSAGLRRCMAGFTLIEMVTVVTIMAILAGMAAPSFQQFIGNQRLRNASYELMAALIQTRSEAVARNTSVDLVRSGVTWDTGWVVSVGSSALHTQNTYSGISITDSADLNKITYGKDGRTVTAATKFTLTTTTTTTGVTPRCVTIGLSGTPSSKLGACS